MRSHIGDPDSDALLCITDLVQCCRKEQTTDGVAIGEWSYPDQSQVQNRFNSEKKNDAFYRTRGQSVVRLHSREGVAHAAGIFRCEVEDISRQDNFVYIGIYPNGTGEWVIIFVPACFVLAFVHRFIYFIFLIVLYMR